MLDSLDHRLKQYIEVLETSGCPRATDLPHQEAEIVSGYVGDQTLEDVLVSAQVDTAHPPGVIIMCEPSFDSFGPETSKQCTSVSFDPASVRIYGIAGIGVRRDCFEGLCRLSQRSRQRLRISFVARTKRHGDDRARIHISDVFDFVRHMCTTVFHLRNAGSWGLCQSVFEVFFFRFLSNFRTSSSVGSSIPEASARPVT